jgi:hypothetical protein
MARMIDQIRASRLPSNMMQFAARGALQVPPAENIEILVYLAKYNKVFGELARMTLAGWDEKASLAVAADPETAQEVLNYLISVDNLRPKLLPRLLENPSVREEQLIKLATSALRDIIEIMLLSKRVRSSKDVIAALKSNPYLKREEAAELDNSMDGAPQPVATPTEHSTNTSITSGASANDGRSEPAEFSHESETSDATFGVEDESVFAYFKEHADDIAAEGEKPFQAIGGIVDMFLPGYSGTDGTGALAEEESASQAPPVLAPAASAAATQATAAAIATAHPKPPAPPKRENALQKINSLDVKGRIQLALKGTKEERSLLIRDGTKVVALAVLEAPKLSDGEVEKFASQKNVLEAVLRQIPLKRRFMKNYKIVRNLVANPRTPLDLGLGLMKNLLIADLKHLSGNKEVSETIRNLAGKMYKQKLDAANKK